MLIIVSFAMLIVALAAAAIGIGGITGKRNNRKEI
jgi:hypothetical protein